ncbi:hypothetical protein J0X19_15280 [Hymenobacter sp. BT186]|uniref:Uncharacterized protein n=1 Tax=Hymenobacter telluris TaxID=2816474 RepID=A0A939EWV0_9BACT|nr:hypothetical protein [Hymenobacter telluris]MBO0359324.1 hypothetical protein [Hymenobacter telluris]MBW3375350.1 hypothetical protein [Hymenobacter norwichensis]
MKMLWCWRCQQEVPMLDAEEALLVRKAMMTGMRFVEEEAHRRGRSLLPMAVEGVSRLMQPMLEMYKLLTGFVETNPNAVMHHEVDQYGPPCPQCTKPLRTPKARFCAACGFGQEDVQADSLPLTQRRPEVFPEL